jgi:hypothetical protein
VLAAVAHQVDALEYASVELQADKEVVLAAVNSRPALGYLTSCVRFASAKLKADKDFAASPSARLHWFYQRTPFYDVNAFVYPVGAVY